ncbi:MAG: phosphatase PAP2 family protein [Gemmatimonadales bacterium]
MAPPAVLQRSWAWLERRIQGFSPLDRLTVVYVACATGILLAHISGWREERPTPIEAGWLLVANGLLFVAVLVAPRARAVRKHSFLAEWYVPFVVSALYAAIGLLNGSPMVVDTSFDRVVQHWELVVFGQQVAYTWGRVMPSVALSWFFGLCYLAFYFIVIVGPAVLWGVGRRAASRQTIYAIVLSFFACYVVFLLFPVGGPPYFWNWPTGPGNDAWPVLVARHIIEGQDSFGTAFPSSHVAAALTAAYFAYRGWRPLGLILLVPALGIIAAVVYLQIHYGVDALAGLLMAVVVCLVTPRLCPATAPLGRAESCADQPEPAPAEA